MEQKMSKYNFTLLAMYNTNNQLLKSNRKPKLWQRTQKSNIFPWLLPVPSNWTALCKLNNRKSDAQYLSYVF